MTTLCAAFSRRCCGPAVGHRHHRASDREREGLLPCDHRADSRVIVTWSITERMRAELAVDALQNGQLAAPARPRRHRPRRPRGSVHLLDLRQPPAGGRTARLDGPGRVQRGQHDDRIALVDRAARTARHPRLGHTDRAGRSDLRVDRGPTQPPPFARHDQHTTRVRRTGSGSRALQYLGGGPATVRSLPTISTAASVLLVCPIRPGVRPPSVSRAVPTGSARVSVPGPDELIRRR